MQQDTTVTAPRRRGPKLNDASAHAPADEKPLTLDPSRMRRKATMAADMLRALANEHRLLILCHLHRGEMSVSELEQALGMRQAHLSQHLARLRADGLVSARRESRSVHYRLGSHEAEQLVRRLYELFCQKPR